jgi:hypothetical protein
MVLMKKIRRGVNRVNRASLIFKQQAMGSFEGCASCLKRIQSAKRVDQKTLAKPSFHKREIQTELGALNFRKTGQD